MRYCILLLFLLNAVPGFSQHDYQDIAGKILAIPAKEKINITILDVAKQFLNKPYVGQTLEKSPEALVVNLGEFDCYTLVENVLALSLAKHFPESGLDSYREHLQLLRYRNGVIEGYGSRIHYFADWANQAVHNGILENITVELGEEQEKPIDFMSSHKNLYPALSDEKTLDQIIEAEKNLSNEEFFYVPKEKFAAVENEIQDGDIIAFTSNVKGLDVNHEGFAIWQDGKLHLLHASLEQKKVIVSTETLGAYLNRVKKHSGVLILRATN